MKKFSVIICNNSLVSTKKLLINLILLLSLSLFNSCNNRGYTIKSRESYVYNEQVWFLLEYSNGTYGAEIGGEVILSNCENKLYMEGYAGDYVLKTQRGTDWLYYNLSGELLFTIPNADFARVSGYHDGTKMRNGYVSVRDYEGKESVYSLDGKRIISPQDCYSIYPIQVNLDNDTRALWGFEVCLKSGRDYIYTYDGDILLSGESVSVKKESACPIFCVENNDRYSLYNYKGKKIVYDTDKYWDYDIEYDDYGCPYIVCKTDYCEERNFNRRNEWLWISMNGEILKEDGWDMRVDYNVRSEERSECNRAKNELRNRMNQLPPFNAPYSFGSNATASGNRGSSYDDGLLYEGIYTESGQGYCIEMGTYVTSTPDMSYKIKIYNDYILVGSTKHNYVRTEGGWRIYKGVGNFGSTPFYKVNPNTFAMSKYTIMPNQYSGGVNTLTFAMEKGEVVFNRNTSNSSGGYNNGMGNTNSNSTASQRSERTKKECRLCDGKGTVVSTKGVSFGMEKWCSECGKRVPTNHHHETCPSCKGEGKW